VVADPLLQGASSRIAASSDVDFIFDVLGKL
jgi:hypothetical protein